MYYLDSTTEQKGDYMIKLNNITKIYKSKKGEDTKALQNVNLSFSKIGLTFILGKSGCGKSTLLNLLGGLDTPTSGEIIFKGKSLNTFKSKDYDSYRNTQVGFVFQEYNLVEKFNVFDNVAYALKLQDKKIDKEKVLIVLDKVGLKDLANRKVNELSGGQKQRVAIARALVKDPSIILADEPTGNLDTESSRLIFDILKSLSQERLIIVVSHDEESANNYADRIIKLQDGIVISDNNQLSEEEQDNYEVQKNHLSFKNALRFSIKNLFGHKVKLVLSILLIAFAMSFFGFSIMQNYLKTDSETIKLMNNLEIEKIRIFRLEKAPSYSPIKGYWLSYSGTEVIEEKDFEELKNNNKTPLYKEYYFNSQDGEIPGMYRRFEESASDYQKLTYYYVRYQVASTFTELKQDEFYFKVIGSYPTNYEEIVIIKPFADFIIKYGIERYNEDYLEVYRPSSYEELVSDRYYIKFGNSKVIISGIKDDDVSEFEILKNYSQDEINNGREENLRKLSYKYGSFFPVSFYALEGFKDNFDLKQISVKPVDINDDVYKLTPYVEGDIYTKDGVIRTTNIAENEIIVNLDYLDSKYNNFTKEMNEYIINGKDLDPSKKGEEYREEFIKDFLSKEDVIGATVAYTIYGNNGEPQEFVSRIVGVTKDEYLYINKSALDSFLPEKYSFNVYTLKSEINNLNDFLEEFPIDGKEFISNTDFSDRIADDAFTMRVLGKYLIIVSLLFAFFAVLLLFNFIGLSISDNKKEIGVLRALGTSKKDISKIYSIQGMLIGIVSYILSILLLCLYAYRENSVIFNSKNTLKIEYLNLVGITWQSLAIMFVFMVVVILLSSITVSYKVSRMKPIDAINNK